MILAGYVIHQRWESKFKSCNSTDWEYGMVNWHPHWNYKLYSNKSRAEEAARYIKQNYNLRKHELKIIPVYYEAT